MNISDIPDCDFVNLDDHDIESEIVNLYTAFTNRQLAQADPIRVFLKFIANYIILLNNNFNFAAKQNLLKYAIGENLDNLAAFWGVIRLQPTPAITTLQFNLSTSNNILIPKGTRVSPAAGIEFATDSDLFITSTSDTVSATCTSTGISGNDFAVGEISTIIDPIAYVQSAFNISPSQGGSAIEDDDSFRQRIFLAPESLSIAGPTQAYIWHVKSFNSSIIDVAVTSPQPGHVNIYPLVKDSLIPSPSLLDKIYNFISADNIRPLTDFVSVLPPSKVNFNINVDFYLDLDADFSTSYANLQTALHNFINWQSAKLGRDINPSMLTHYLMQVSGVHHVNVLQPAFSYVQPAQIPFCSNFQLNFKGRDSS